MLETEVADLAAAQDELDAAVIEQTARESARDAAQSELDAADAEVSASIVTKTGIGTGSAQVVGLGADDLVALGEGAVAVSSVATDPAGNTDSDGTGFTLDTITCLLYTSPSPRDGLLSRMPSSA